MLRSHIDNLWNFNLPFASPSIRRPTPGNGAGQHRPVPQGFGEDVRALRVGRKAAEQNILAVVNDDAGAFLPVVLLQLRKALDDGHHADPSGTACGEHHLHGLDLRYRADLVRKHHDPVRQLSPMFVRDGEHLPVKLLEE